MPLCGLHRDLCAETVGRLVQRPQQAFVSRKKSDRSPRINQEASGAFLKSRATHARLPQLRLLLTQAMLLEPQASTGRAGSRMQPYAIAMAVQHRCAVLARTCSARPIIADETCIGSCILAAQACGSPSQALGKLLELSLAFQQALSTPVHSVALVLQRCQRSSCCITSAQWGIAWHEWTDGPVRRHGTWQACYGCLHAVVATQKCTVDECGYIPGCKASTRPHQYGHPPVKDSLPVNMAMNSASVLAKSSNATSVASSSHMGSRKAAFRVVGAAWW